MTLTTFLRLWILATAIVVVGLLVWELAPVVYVAVAIAAGFGVVSLAMVALARWIERARR
jgi:hypothetical protein